MILRKFTISAPVVIRTCVREDLPQLEWFGMFSDHREIIESTFEAQERGEQIMLIAEIRGLPGGQIWIDFIRKKKDSTAVLWALRVVPWCQNLGIGSELLRSAEETIRSRGFQEIELGVEKNNERARRLYERFGYKCEGSVLESYSYTTTHGVRRTVPVDQWVFRKKCSWE